MPENKRSTYLPVSIVVPAHNEEGTIKRCLESLRSQDYPDKIEIIVVDDGSRDQTVTIARQYRVKVLRQAHSGPGAARNRGVEEASYEIIGFLDADDAADRQWLKECFPHLNERKVAAVGCLEHPLNHSKFATLVWLEKYHKLLALPERTSHIGSSGCLYKRTVFLKLGGFNTRLLAAEDMELCNRAREKGYDLIFIKERLFRVLYPDNLVQYFFDQVRKGGYLVLFHWQIKGSRAGGGSYTGLLDYIQALFPFAFLSSLFFLDGFKIAIVGVILFLLLLGINAPYLGLFFNERKNLRIGVRWTLFVPLYLVIRSIIWGIGLLYGLFLVAKSLPFPYLKKKRAAG